MADAIESLTGLVAVLLPVWIIWVIMYYRHRSRSQGSFNEDEIRQIEELNEVAERMAERIKTLESILDSEMPEWRDHDAKD